ncbi:MAG: MBL fold metallo-hydrolase [Pseudomonadota bacterium]
MSDLSFRTEMEFAYGEPRGLGPGLIRLTANNPSVFTFKGTNTYIVGDTSLAIIDPGPDDAAHRDAVLKAVGGRPVSHILITHTHRDHIDGLDAMVNATGAVVCGYGRDVSATDERLLSPSGRAFIDTDFEPEHPLRDGDEIAGEGWTLRAIHTPGHAPDHLCFHWAQRKIVFSGDHVMGWNTTVVAPPEGHMGDYLASLMKLTEIEADVFHAGHGGQIRDPIRVTKAYLVHRRMREQAIADAIRNGHDTINAVVALIYAQIDPALHRAAAMSVEAHVAHMIEKGMARVDGVLTHDTQISMTR